MTTFQRLVKRGFEQGTSHGMEMQTITILKKMLQQNFSVHQIAEILDVKKDLVVKFQKA